MEKNRIRFLLISFFFFLVFTLLFVSAACEDETDVEDIPCEAITPILTFSGDCNATILDLSSYDINYTINITPVGDGTYNFTFNYTNISSYGITLDCGNYSATINVDHFDEDYNDKWLYFYGFTLGLGILLFVLGYKNENYILTLLSGFLFMAFSITFISQGYPTIDTSSMNISIILLSLAVGLYLTGNSSIGLIKEGM